MNKVIVQSFVLMILTSFFVTPAMAVEVIDIEQAQQGGGLAGALDWQQVFVPGASNITAVSVYNDPKKSANASVTVQILDAVCGTVLAHGSASGDFWVKCDLVGPEALIPGTPYVLRVTTASPSLGVSGSNPYPDGGLYLGCSLYDGGGPDLMFRTWTDEQAVPSDPSSWGAVKSMFR